MGIEQLLNPFFTKSVILKGNGSSEYTKPFVEL